MAASGSEHYLLHLAEQSFLKLWAIGNPFRKPGKEISDLVVAFGKDVVIFSDKACEFDLTVEPELAWSRWRRSAIDESLKQLRGAVRKLSEPNTKVFTDAKATEVLPYALAPPAKRRFHLVGIARPSTDPAGVPAAWRTLTYVDVPQSAAFTLEPVYVSDRIVHVFDGPTIDLLLAHLDTAPDFISYLSARAKRLKADTGYAFAERDLLAAAMLNWEEGSGLTPEPPNLDAIVPGLWDSQVKSGFAAGFRERNRGSHTIDNLIEHQHREYAAGRYLYSAPDFARHESTMRLLAAESRFARRMIVTELYDILEESDQRTFWASTVPSPTTPFLRYLWLTCPQPPPDWPTETVDSTVQQELRRYVLLACATFPETFVLGVALPARESTDKLVVMELFDASSWTDADRAEAMKLERPDAPTNWAATTRVHIP